MRIDEYVFEKIKKVEEKIEDLENKEISDPRDEYNPEDYL